MKFSVIVPVLNEEKYIAILLNSLLWQTHKDFEVIVVDAGSTDHTSEVVHGFRSVLPLTFVTSDKRGVAQQRNYGATLAKYDHLIFFDADVAPPSDFLYQLNRKLQRRPKDVLTCWNEPMSKKVFDKVLFGAFNLIYMETVKYFSPAAVGTFIYVTKESFNAVKGFDPEVFPGEDFDLIRRLHKEGYSYGILRKPTIPFSVRRLNEEGRKNFIKKQLKAGVYYHLKGSIKNPHLVEHKMGSHL